MKDNFLYKFRAEPRDEFARELYRKISDEAESVPGDKPGFPILRWIILLFAVIVVGGCSYLSLSPTARANVLDKIRQIAGVTYNEVPQYPKIEPEEIVPIQFHIITLSEAQKKLPFNLVFPSWIPDGYRLLEDSVRYYSYDEESADLSNAYNIYLTWSKNNISRSGSNIILVEQPIFSPEQYEDNMMPVGPGSLSEVKIGEVVGTLIRGSWDSTTQLWNTESGQLTLRWSIGDMHYLLIANERDVPLEDLIKMAESIK